MRMLHLSGRDCSARRRRVADVAAIAATVVVLDGLAETALRAPGKAGLSPRC